MAYITPKPAKINDLYAWARPAVVSNHPIVTDHYRKAEAMLSYLMEHAHLLEDESGAVLLFQIEGDDLDDFLLWGFEATDFECNADMEPDDPNEAWNQHPQCMAGEAA